MSTTIISRPTLAGVTVRRIFSGFSLMAFPALLVVNEVVDPAEGGTGRVMYEAATDHRAALLVAAATLILSALFNFPAIVAIVRQSRDRGARLANAGAFFAVLGAAGHVCIGLFYIISSALPGGDEQEMINFIERLNDSAALGLSVFPMILGFALGVLLLPWAAYRAGLIGIWGPIVTTIAFVVHGVLPSGLPLTGFAANVAVFAVFGFLGYRILTTSDREWVGA